MPQVPAGGNLSLRLKLIYNKYKVCALNQKPFISFCKEFFEAVGAEKALFFLAKYVSDQEVLLQIYPAVAGELDRPILLDQPAQLADLIANALKFSPVEAFSQIPLRELLAASGIGFAAQDKLYLLPVQNRGKLLGVFLFVNPECLEKTAARQNTDTANFLKLVQKLVQSEIDRLAHKQELLERDILLRMAQKIGSSLRLETVLDNMVDSLRQVLPYDSAAIFLINHKTGEIEYEIARGYPPEASQFLRIKIGQGLSGWVAKTGKPVILPDVSKDSRYIRADPQTRSEMAVPMKIGKKIIGVFNLERRVYYGFTHHQAKLLEAFAASAAIAIQNARLYKLAKEKKELERDLLVARKIQSALLPRRLPHSRNIYLSAFNRPSKQVGGDLYDALKLSDGKIALAVADISGKGVPGALLMASLHAIYRAEIWQGLSAHKLMARVNRQFTDLTTDGNFATFFHALIDPRGNAIEYCSAGHNPAILMKRDGSSELLESTGVIIGFLKQAPYQSKRVSFEPGDVLVAYSDGITEAENEHQELFGKDRLVEVVRSLKDGTPAQIRRGIIEALETFVSHAPIEDDVTLLVAKYQVQKK